jgi:hypothetical protein
LNLVVVALLRVAKSELLSSCSLEKLLQKEPFQISETALFFVEKSFDYFAGDLYTIDKRIYTTNTAGIAAKLIIGNKATAATRTVMRGHN